MNNDREELMREIRELLRIVGYYEGILEQLGIQLKPTSREKKKTVIIQHDFRRKTS